MSALPPKASLTILCFGLLMGAMAALKLVRVPRLISVIDFQPRLSDPPLPEPIKKLAVSVHAPGQAPVPPASAQLSDPGDALGAFYTALQRTESGKGVTRILHYGDSPVTADSITADLRSLLQERFGDAGHGFVLIAKPWAWYGHRGVELNGSGWRIEPATQGERARDGLHGLGGVAFEGGPGARSEIRLATGHDTVELSYLARPGGGTVVLRSGEQPVGIVNTASESVKSGWAEFPLPAHARELTLEVESGDVRLFGLSFEKSGSGVIYNSLGLNGGQVQVIVRYFNAAHWAGQLQHQRPDLVVVNYGTNESVYPKYLETFYPAELGTVIRRIKAALPDASILVMSPMDRGQRGDDGEITTLPALPRIVAIQRQVARETGCAFFNTFEAMGGDGTMARWYASRPRLVSADFMHPFPAGARKIGVLLDDALIAGYERFKARTPGVLN